jgi:hypothetical protein
MSEKLIALYDIQRGFEPESCVRVSVISPKVCLVDANNKMLIGRPFIYKVSDEISNIITGIYVGLGNITWSALSNALDNCTEDKVKLCEKYDLHIDENKWPAALRPRKVRMDNGVILGKPMLSEYADIIIEKHPQLNYKDRKCDIRFIKHLNNFILQEHELSNMVHKGFSIEMSLDHFTKIVLKSIIHFNKGIIVDQNKKYYC